MAIKVGINGFGRMGRLAFRVAWESTELEVVHINEIAGGAQTAAHLLEFDSVHGRWDKDISFTDDAIVVEKSAITFTNESTPGAVDWAASNVDLVIEASGKFRTQELLSPYYDRGVKKVVVAAPVKSEGAVNIVMGVNDEIYNPAQDHLLTAASCTTNCLAPVVKVLQEQVGIEHGSFTTIHDMTNTQIVVDAPHKDLRRARAASMSLIPTTTGSATAITMIYPELMGKLNGHAVRVPLLNASITDATFEMKRAVTSEEINRLFEDASQSSLAGILGVEHRPLVSVDYKGDTRSSIIDALSTMVVDGTQLKILAWYDNEMGYVHRMVELCCKVARSLPR